MQLFILMLITNLFSFETKPYKDSLLEKSLTEDYPKDRRFLGGIFRVHAELMPEKEAKEVLEKFPNSYEVINVEELLIPNSDFTDGIRLKKVNLIIYTAAYNSGNFSIIHEHPKGVDGVNHLVVPSLLRKDIKFPFKKIDLKFDTLKIKGEPHEIKEGGKPVYVTDFRIDIFHLPYLQKNKKDTEQKVKISSSMGNFTFLEKCSFTEKTCSFKLQNSKGKVVYEFISRLTDPNEDSPHKLIHHEYEKLEIKNGMDFNRDGKLDFYLEEHYGDTHKTDIVFLISDPKSDKYEKVRLGSNNEDTFSLNYP